MSLIVMFSWVMPVRESAGQLQFARLPMLPNVA
jgi:hypothetical protein